MTPKNVSQLIESASAPWKPSKIQGVQYLPLHADEDERAGSFLLKLNPGTSYPRHRHPAGEEIFVMRGEMTVGDRKLKAGDYLYSPPGSVHDANTTDGCLFMSILPKAIEIIGFGTTSEYEEPKPEAEGLPPSPQSSDPLKQS